MLVVWADLVVAKLVEERIDQPVGKRLGVGQRDGALDLPTILVAHAPQQAVPGVAAERHQFAAGQRLGAG